jgi:hypothetical protein
MSFELSSSFERSYHILKKLQNLKLDDKKWFTGIWINGREEGITLTNYSDKIKIIFTQSRNSDAMVIYYGKQDDFEGYFGMITEKIFNKCMYLNDEEEVLEKILFLMKIENWI